MGILRRYRMRGQAAIVSAGIALAAILLTAISGVSYWTTHEMAVDAEQAQLDRARALATSIAPALEALLAQNDVSTVRRIISETAIAQGLPRCRIVLPNGRVVAAAAGTDRITAVTLPKKWSEKQTPADTDPATFTQPLVVPERGLAFLQIAPAAPNLTNRRMETLTSLGAIGAVAVFGLGLVYRRVQKRLRAITSVRMALLEMAPNGSLLQPSPPPLVSPELGPEAVAWNALMAERINGRKDTLAEKARLALGRRQQVRGDLDAACDAMTHGLVLLDDRGRVKYANGAAAAFLRMDREKLMGANSADVIREPAVVAALKEVASGTMRRRAVIDVERGADMPAGSAKVAGGMPQAGGVLRFSVRPVRREDSASAMVIIEDITQQKAAEEARHAFVAQATHELRTPLTNIRLYVETAIEDGEQDPLVRTKALNVINSEARRLERIVGEMLSVAEIEAGSFKLKTGDVRLDALFEELRHDYSEQAKDKSITLTFLLPPKLPVLTGDRDKVAIALHNLVGNALKYTPSGGSVTLRVEASESANTLTVAVADTGIGIAPDDCPRVFERFYRASDKRVEKITGTGLGLTIAREVARLHGGDITVDSQLDHGSTFTLTLPVKAAA